MQFKASWERINLDTIIYADMPLIDYYFHGSYYKYTIGREKSEEDCDNLLDFAHKKGYKDAFVVAFYNAKRITLDEANLLKTKK